VTADVVMQNVSRILAAFVWRLASVSGVYREGPNPRPPEPRTRDPLPV
jgi:hypothetical protein